MQVVANLDSDASDQNKKFAKLSLTAEWLVWYAKKGKFANRARDSL